MPVTGVRGRQILDDSVTRADINVTASGSALITRILVGAGLVVQSSTGADSGTGDVTLALGNSGVTAGTYGSSSLVPVITVDQYGRITGVTTQAVSGGGGGTTLNGTGFVVMSGTTPSYLTGTASQFVKADGTLDSTAYASLAGATFTGQIISTRANNATTGAGQIFLNGASGNRIDFNINGAGNPSFTTRSAGTKIVLYPQVGAAAVDYAIGIGTASMWYSVPDASASFNWFSGTTNIASLSATGGLITTGTINSVKAGTADFGDSAIYLQGFDHLRIDFDQQGTGAPTLPARSAGTKIVYRQRIGFVINEADYATGVDVTNFALWNSVPTANAVFRWYGGTTIGATLTGGGALTLADQLQITRANNATTGSGQIFLNGTTGNRIDFNNQGTADPSFTTRSAGTKIVFRPLVNASSADYAMGIGGLGQSIWISLPVATSTHSFRILAGNGTNALFSVRGDDQVFARNLNSEVINSSVAFKAITGSTIESYNADSSAYVHTIVTGGTGVANYTWFHSPSTRQAVWSWSANTANRTYTLPNASGTLVVSVNGTTADANGNITIAGGGGGTTTNAVTFNNSGSGAASGTTFNGSAAITVSHNTIGAQPLNTNLTSLGALSFVSSSLVRMTAAGTFALDTNTYITGNQSITISGDASGSGATAITLTLANSGVTAGTYRSVTVDAKGRVTGGTNPTTISGYGITDFYSQVISGFATGSNTSVTNTDSLEVAIEKLQGQVNARISGNQTITLSGAVTGSGTTAIATTLAASVVGISNINATGTPSSTTFLRGDGVWATPAAGGGSQWVTSGSNIYFVFDFASNVGIGQTSPARALHITKINGGAAMIRLEQTAQRTWDIGTNESSQSFAIRDASASANRLLINTSGQLNLSTYTTTNSYTYTGLQGNLGFTSSGDIVTTPTAFVNIDFVAAGNLILNNMASALQFFNNQTAYIRRVDLTHYKRIRLHVQRGGTSGAAGSKLIIRYRRTIDGFSTLPSGYIDFTSECSVLISGTNTFFTSTWITLPVNAQGDVYLALLQSGGDGSADPIIGGVTAEIDYRI